ncbi:MAG: hypothetical protein N4A35_05900 [Flavobacteriales bacterium]|jgi:hypothetical protein|nr:hypothetical protein [Flavobacteriales bacterium]
MIKKLLLCSIAFAGVGLLYGQDVEPDSRLTVKYTKSELQELKSNDQEQLEFLNFCIDNAYTIMPFPEEKAAASEIRGSVTLGNMNEINFFSLGYELEEENWQYYRINGSQKMLVIFSKEEVLRRMKK